MSVVLTGGNGFLGKYVQEELRARNIEFVNFTRDSGDLMCFYDFANFVSGLPNTFNKCIHLAAKVGGIGANEKSRYDFIFDNLVMGLNVIEVCRVRNFSKFVMTSTVCAYPANTTIPFHESDLWKGYPEWTNAPYGIAKRTLTEVLSAARSQYGLKSKTLNLANLYGIGDSDNIETNHVIPAIFRKMTNWLGGNVHHFYAPTGPIELWGDGSPTRDFLHVRDAARAVVDSINDNEHYLASHASCLNIGTGVETSIKEVAYKIAKLMNVPESEITWDGNRPNGQQRRCLDTTAANIILGWSPRISLDDGLKELGEYYHGLCRP